MKEFRRIYTLKEYEPAQKKRILMQMLQLTTYNVCGDTNAIYGVVIINMCRLDTWFVIVSLLIMYSNRRVPLLNA